MRNTFSGFGILVSVKGTGPSSTVSSVFGFSGVFWGLITVGNQLMTRTAGTVITMNNCPRGSDAKEHSSRSTKIYSSREYSLLLNSS